MSSSLSPLSPNGPRGISAARSLRTVAGNPTVNVTATKASSDASKTKFPTLSVSRSGRDITSITSPTAGNRSEFDSEDPYAEGSPRSPAHALSPMASGPLAPLTLPSLDVDGSGRPLSPRSSFNAEVIATKKERLALLQELAEIRWQKDNGVGLDDEGIARDEAARKAEKKAVEEMRAKLDNIRDLRLKREKEIEALKLRTKELEAEIRGIPAVAREEAAAAEREAAEREAAALEEDDAEDARSEVEYQRWHESLKTGGAKNVLDQELAKEAAAKEGKGKEGGKGGKEGKKMDPNEEGLEEIDRLNAKVERLQQKTETLVLNSIIYESMCRRSQSSRDAAENAVDTVRLAHDAMDMDMEAVQKHILDAKTAKSSSLQHVTQMRRALEAMRVEWKKRMAERRKLRTALATVNEKMAEERAAAEEARQLAMSEAEAARKQLEAAAVSNTTEVIVSSDEQNNFDRAFAELRARANGSADPDDILTAFRNVMDTQAHWKSVLDERQHIDAEKRTELAALVKEREIFRATHDTEFLSKVVNDTREEIRNAAKSVTQVWRKWSKMEKTLLTARDGLVNLVFRVEAVMAETAQPQRPAKDAGPKHGRGRSHSHPHPQPPHKELDKVIKDHGRRRSLSQLQRVKSPVSGLSADSEGEDGGSPAPVVSVVSGSGGPGSPSVKSGRMSEEANTSTSTGEGDSSNKLSALARATSLSSLLSDEDEEDEVHSGAGDLRSVSNALVSIGEGGADEEGMVIGGGGDGSEPLEVHEELVRLLGESGRVLEVLLAVVDPEVLSGRMAVSADAINMQKLMWRKKNAGLLSPVARMVSPSWENDSEEDHDDSNLFYESEEDEVMNNGSQRKKPALGFMDRSAVKARSVSTLKALPLKDVLAAQQAAQELAAAHSAAAAAAAVHNQTQRSARVAAAVVTDDTEVTSMTRTNTFDDDGS
eukprot:jgi/Mesvir1/14709/Mv05362-RA.1